MHKDYIEKCLQKGDYNHIMPGGMSIYYASYDRTRSRKAKKWASKLQNKQERLRARYLIKNNQEQKIEKHIPDIFMWL